MANFNRSTEIAGTGEYVRLEFRVQLTPISTPAQYAKLIAAQLAGDDRYIVARAPTNPVVGAETLGFGYGVSEAVIRTTALANNVPYDSIFSGFDSFGGVIPSVSLIDWDYVDNGADSQFTAAGAPILPGLGAPPSAVQKALGADPLNPAGLIPDGLVPDAKGALQTTGTIIEIALGVAAIIAIAFLVREWKS